MQAFQQQAGMAGLHPQGGMGGMPPPGGMGGGLQPPAQQMPQPDPPREEDVQALTEFGK